MPPLHPGVLPSARGWPSHSGDPLLSGLPGLHTGPTSLWPWLCQHASPPRGWSLPCPALCSPGGGGHCWLDQAHLCPSLGLKNAHCSSSPISQDPSAQLSRNPGPGSSWAFRLLTTVHTALTAGRSVLGSPPRPHLPLGGPWQEPCAGPLCSALSHLSFPSHSPHGLTASRRNGLGVAQAPPSALLWEDPPRGAASRDPRTAGVEV